jgi:monoamine oxidase
MATTTERLSRHDLLAANPQLSGWAAIASSRGAIAEYLKRARNKVEVPNRNIGQGKRAVIIGAGVAGLTSAYELLVNEIGCSCVILEANQRAGGRNLTLRPGDVLQEDGFAPQVCDFDREENQPYEPYLNAGPGRIPSAHTHLLDYLKRFNVPLEVYVMDSRSNLTYVAGAFGGSVPNRRLDNDTRGWIAQMLFRFLNNYPSTELSPEEINAFKLLLEKFGDLKAEGEDRGSYLGSSRSGYTHLPGVGPGEIEKPLQLKELLASKFWKETSFYQPQDFLWQPTLFQPVGGMDKVVDAFKQKVEQLGGDIRLGAVATKIAYSAETGKYRIHYRQNNGEEQIIEADYCFSNVPIPLLKNVLDDAHFDQSFQAALHAVYQAQEGPKDVNGKYKGKFLADTTKVGWQAKRDLWQKAKNPGDVPIYGGISWSNDEIVQIWYPSDDYHAELGVLTGAYNFQSIAFNWGEKPPAERLEIAKTGARNLGGEAFANGLGKGLAIAWQNMPYQKGGWAYWGAVEDSTTHYNNLIQGNKNFYIVGDQLSALPGWQEGAVVSAINAVNRVADPIYTIPELDFLPDPRLMVEGV